MIQSILNRLFQHVDIASGGDLYLRRWRVLRLGRLRVNLHYIARSDADQELHDHPWNYLSIILWGGYREETFIERPHWSDRSLPPTRFEWCGMGRILRRHAWQAHRLELDRPAWTLVFLGRNRRQWGFWTRDRWWVYWRDFLNVPEGAPSADFGDP